MTDKFLDVQPLRFGKHKGKTPRDVAKIDPQYVVWMHANVLPPPCSRDLARDCEEARSSDYEREDDWMGRDY